MSAFFLRRTTVHKRKSLCGCRWDRAKSGVPALALRLGLPADVPQQNETISELFCAAAFSLAVQGLTIMLPMHGWGETTLHHTATYPEEAPAS
jgi:hypothetical protein